MAPALLLSDLNRLGSVDGLLIGEFTGVKAQTQRYMIYVLKSFW